MNNQEILQKIVAYIEAIMVDKSMTSRDLAEICAKKVWKNVASNDWQNV